MSICWLSSLRSQSLKTRLYEKVLVVCHFKMFSIFNLNYCSFASTKEFMFTSVSPCQWGYMNATALIHTEPGWARLSWARSVEVTLFKRVIPSASLLFILILFNNSRSQFPSKLGIRVQHYAFTFNLYKQLIVMHNAARQVWKHAHRLWIMLIEFEDEVSCRQIVCDFILCYNYSC